MERLENFIRKINFKKAATIYIFLSIFVILACVYVVVYVTRDKIYMAINYQRATQTFRKEGVNDKLKSELKLLTTSSKDIINAVILDKKNNVIFKANNSIIGDNTTFTLAPYEGNNKYLQDNINKDLVYMVEKDENILLNMNYIKEHKNIEAFMDEDYSYFSEIDSKDIKLINYKVDKTTKDKLFIIQAVNPIPYAETLVAVIGSILGLIFAVYWIGLALWVYKDADNKKNNPSLWGILVLLTNLVGLIIYTMYKQNNRECVKCGAAQSKENIYCSLCGAQLIAKCSSCGNRLNKGDIYCSKCGDKL